MWSFVVTDEVGRDCGADAGLDARDRAHREEEVWKTTKLLENVAALHAENCYGQKESGTTKHFGPLAVGVVSLRGFEFEGFDRFSRVCGGRI